MAILHGSPGKDLSADWSRPAGLVYIPDRIAKADANETAPSVTRLKCKSLSTCSLGPEHQASGR